MIKLYKSLLNDTIAKWDDRCPLTLAERAGVIQKPTEICDKCEYRLTCIWMSPAEFGERIDAEYEKVISDLMGKESNNK